MRRIYTVVLFVVMASIDNTVLALLPAVAPSIREEFAVADRMVALIVGINLLVVALAGLMWGYRSDQADRRRLLLIGTLAWALPVGLVPWIDSYVAFFGLMILAGLGLGCISTVGYSIITDLVPERWRGLMLGVWGLAQGIGSLTAGILVGRMVADSGWRAPFGLMATVGLICAGLALLALSPRKGGADEALRNMGEYRYRIKRDDLPAIFRKPSNRWLMLQGFLAQLAYGPLFLVVVLLTARLTAQGLPVSQANGVAALLWVVFQLGGIISLLWGWLGDRLQRRNPRARALMAAYGFWVAIPAYLLLFWSPLPLTGSTIGNATQIFGAQLASNAWWWLAILGATVAVAAQATNAPNWFAMVSEVNLPEHRGTAFSFVTLANNVGRALGTLLVGVTFDLLQRVLAAPTNYALGLTIFQLFFIPAGLCFWQASRTAPRDAAEVQQTLRSRAAGQDHPPESLTSPAPAVRA
jgi:MFS transporter, Spinster family, sphingosine-1-phosphate transporter